MFLQERKGEALSAVGGRSGTYQSLTTEEVDILGVTSFVCLLYGLITSNITEARYKAFMRMSGGKGNDLLARLKKINCAILSHHVPKHYTLKEHSM